MTQALKKDSLIYSYMSKYRVKNNIIILIMLGLTIGYYALFGAYISNVLFGAVPLDTELFVSDAGYISPVLDTEPEDKSIKSSVLKGDSYWQGNKYEFKVSLNSIEYTDIDYTTENTNEGFNAETQTPVRSALLYSAKIEDVPVLVLAYPHQVLSADTELNGIFAPIAPVIKWDIYNSQAYADKEVFPYILDARGLSVESEPFDVMIFFTLAIITLLLLAKNIVYYIWPYLTPTYRGLARYGDPAEMAKRVELQLAGKGTDKIQKNNPVYTEDWIVSRDVFKLSITKNHAKPQDNSRYGSRF